MFKDLNYYKDLSEQLEKEIEIYESSYENFEKAIDLTKNRNDFTQEEKRIYAEFVNFCQEEGFSKDRRVVSANYKDIKENISERVKFLKEQKDINDKMLSLYTELDKLKNKGELSESEIETIKRDAEKHYDVGTEKYNQEVERNKKRVIASKTEKVNDSIQTTKEEEKKFKKENGITKVISSTFGPAGNVIHNAYAKVHNLNVDLRKKRVLNLIVKFGMVTGYAMLCTSLHLTGLPLLLSVPVGVYATYKTIANTFKKVPEKLQVKDKVVNLGESWFRFKKSRGLGEKTLTSALYKGIDFFKYESKEETAVVENDTNEKENNVEKEPTKIEETEREVKPLETEVVTPSVVESPETLIEEEKKDSFEDKTPIEEVKEPVKVETSKEESKKTIKTETPVEEIKEPTKVEEKKETVKKTKIKEFIPEKNSGTEISSIYDIMQEFEKFKKQDGIKTIDDWYTYKNIRKYIDEKISNGDFKYTELKKLFDEMAKNITPELRSRIQTMRTFEKIDTSNKRKSMQTMMKDATNQYREKEYQRIVELIQTANANEVVMEEVNNFINHYNNGITTEQRRNIMELLKEREEKVNESLGRGK